jgi:tetratricopeptide (TPR) repeat protein
MRRQTAYSYPGAELKKHWDALHAGDREPYPTAARITKLAKGEATLERSVARHGGAASVAAALEEAWRALHAGDFLRAMETGREQEALGVAVANKAAAIHTLYLEKNDRKRLEILRAAVKYGESAVELLPDYANAHYTLALALGRYSQKISILEALAAGYGGKIRTHLERTLALEPKHAEAHVALGLYHAELVSTLGSLAARMTYGASERAALEHFKRAIALAPGSAIAHVEYARGLLLLDADAHREQVEELCSLAASCKPLDMMEQLDIDRAKHHCTRV